MKREFSAGGIVFNQKGQVLLTQNSSNHHWGFPKGWIDEGESSKEAAIREVEEEGGVDAEIVSKVGDTKFVYTNQDKEKVFKMVTYFLMNYLAGDPVHHDFEVENAGWFDIEDALKTLSFSSDKKLLQTALEMKNG